MNANISLIGICSFTVRITDMWIILMYETRKQKLISVNNLIYPYYHSFVSSSFLFLSVLRTVTDAQEKD